MITVYDYEWDPVTKTSKSIGSWQCVRTKSRIQELLDKLDDIAGGMSNPSQP